MGIRELISDQLWPAKHHAKGTHRTEDQVTLCRHAMRGEKGEGADPQLIVMTGLTWGAFMGGSSNLRYQVSATKFMHI